MPEVVLRQAGQSACLQQLMPRPTLAEGQGAEKPQARLSEMVDPGSGLKERQRSPLGIPLPVCALTAQERLVSSQTGPLRKRARPLGSGEEIQRRAKISSEWRMSNDLQTPGLEILHGEVSVQGRDNLQEHGRDGCQDRPEYRGQDQVRNCQGQLGHS